MTDIEDLQRLVSSLKIAVDEKSEDVIQVLDSIISQFDGPDKDVGSSGAGIAAQVAALLGSSWSNAEVYRKAAMVVAAAAKCDAGRQACSTAQLTVPLINLLASPNTPLPLLVQACRALGNICYENGDGRRCVLEGEGLTHLLALLKRCGSERWGLTDDDGRQLQPCAAGFLLNLIMGQEHLYSKVIEMGVQEVLCSILEMGVTSNDGEEAAVHILIILGLLTDSAGGSLELSERLCNAVVKVLETSTSGELGELCLELLHSQAENESVRLHVAKAGLCELLIGLLEKHRPLAEDDETRNLFKMACDLIILILNGDDSMTLLYGDGKGKVFQGMVAWLSSSDVDLQITGVLAIGNFARTDKHCIQMVKCGVSKKLLAIVARNNTSAADIRLQHALLSALRNLVIHGQNKAPVLADGLLDAVCPMLSVPTFPVVFKLLGTLRMVIDGQEEAAVYLGSKTELITQLVAWCATEDHPGVQGEANRLLAWLIKNSRDRNVMGCMVECGAVASLVGMVLAEHVVMQTEALLALSLLAAMRLADAQPALVAANVGENIAMLAAASTERDIFLNILALVGHLATSGEMKAHLRETGVPRALKTQVKVRDNLCDVKEQVMRLTSMLDSG